MIIYKAPSEELLKDVNEHREMLHKQAEDALKANEKNAEEIEKNHGEDTKKEVISSKALKAMHLSESLFEDLSEVESSNFNSDIYHAIYRICETYKYDGITAHDVEMALDQFLIRFVDDEDFDEIFAESTPQEIPGFEGTQDALNNLSLFPESLNEDLSSKGKQILGELKKELGPELQKKVAFVIKDYAQNSTPKEDKKESAETEEITEDVDVKRYSDSIPYDQRKYWYFTRHGIGPGTIPKDLNVLDVVEDDNFGTYVCLDGVLNTSELDKYEMKEQVPPEELLTESIKFNIAKEQLKRYTEGKMPAQWNPDRFLENLVNKKHITNEQAQTLKDFYIHE